MHIFKDTKYDFLRWRWHALVLSWVIIIAGIFVLATKGIPKGVEFAGGTVVITEFAKPTSVEDVRKALEIRPDEEGYSWWLDSSIPALHWTKLSYRRWRPDGSTISSKTSTTRPTKNSSTRSPTP